MGKSPSVPIGPVYQRVATTLFVVIMLVVAWNLIVAVQSDPGVQNILRVLVWHVPTLCYLGAIWYARNTFKRHRTGVSFDEILPKALHRIGMFCVAGSLFRVFAQAALLHILGSQGGYLTYDPAAFALIAVGIILVMLSRLCERALEMKQHLYEIV